MVKKEAESWRDMMRIGMLVIIISTALITVFTAVSTANAQIEIPEPYAGMENRVPAAESIAAGKKIYGEQCSMCHGESGDGKGPISESLVPKPANFKDTEGMVQLTDAYLFWRISEGGGFEPFNSTMPAKKSVLGEKEIWNVVNYLRTFSLEEPEEPTPPPSEEGEEEDISKLGVNLRAYSIGSVGILATIILIIFTYIVIRKEGY